MWRRANIRQVLCEEEQYEQLVVINRVKSKQAVTEERLSQFGSSLRDIIVQDLRDLVKRQDRETRNQQLNSNEARGYQKFVCYECKEEGHIKKNCQLLRQSEQQKVQQSSQKQTEERKPQFQIRRLAPCATTLCQAELSSR